VLLFGRLLEGRAQRACPAARRRCYAPAFDSDPAEALHDRRRRNHARQAWRSLGEGDARPAERRLLEGPRPRGVELVEAVRIFAECLKGFRRLHFVGPCVTVFGSARFKEDHPY
jgi:hypothetical protein